MVELAYSDERAEAFRAYMCLYGYKAAIDRCDWVAARRWFYEKEGERSRATARRALFCVACIHCGAEMTDEFVPELIQRWNTRVTATASIDKEVMEGAFDKERRDVAARLWKHIGKPLFTGQDVEDIIGVQRSDFDVVLADASYRRLADLIEPEPERTCGEFEEA